MDCQNYGYGLSKQAPGTVKTMAMDCQNVPGTVKTMAMDCQNRRQRTVKTLERQGTRDYGSRIHGAKAEDGPFAEAAADLLEVQEPP